MKIVIQKFGGTSVASEDGRQHVIGKIKKALAAGRTPVVAVSAMGRKGSPYATDTLLGLTGQAGRPEMKRNMDLLLSCGELISAVVLADELTAEGLKAAVLTGAQAGIITDGNHNDARIIDLRPEGIKKHLEAGEVVIVTGFQGVTEDGEVTTLGRGGSDTTAAALGVALDAEAIEIYTDVEGIMTADPRIVPDAKILDSITYNELCNLAYLGAKVVHPRAVEMAMTKQIPLWVRSTFSEHRGTLVIGEEGEKSVEDLARRDFTVGAMAWHPERGLCDPFGGQTDLKNGVLRAVGDADTRFQEDALRILRGLRFASKLGFAIEPETAAAMRRQVHRLDCIAAERIREELTGLLCGRYVQRTLMAYADLITSALPELAPMQGCQQQNPHHLYDVWEHTVRAVGQVPAEPVLRWAMLLHDSGKPACKTVDEQGIGHFRGHPRASLALSRKLLPRLRFSSADTERILLLVERHDTPLGDNEKLVRRSLSRIGEARFRDLLAIKKGDAVGQGTSRDYVAQLFETEALLNRVLAQEQCFSLRQLAVNGADLQALGLRGRPVGEMLHALLDAVIDGQTDNRRDTLLRLARTRMEEQHDK